jgi:hypothetical protein
LGDASDGFGGLEEGVGGLEKEGEWQARFEGGIREETIHEIRTAVGHISSESLIKR